MKDLKGKVAIVTGSTRGIGRVAAIELAKLGATVVVSGRSIVKQPGEIGAGRNTIEDIEAIGGEAYAVETNLAKPEGVDHLIQSVMEKFGGCDILVNNAAFMGESPDFTLGTLTKKTWEMSFNVNLNSPLWLTQAFAPTMKARGGGVIINVTSRAGDFTEGPGDVKGFNYGTTKAALNLMSQRLGRDLAPDNIAVVILDPGFTASEMIIENATKQVAENVKGDFTPNNAHSMLIPALTITNICTSDNPFQFVGPIIIAEEFIKSHNISIQED